MLALRIFFKSKDETHMRVLTDTLRESDDSKSAQNFAFTTDENEEHIFYSHEELLEVRDNIVRVLNRRGPPGEEFDENFENVKGCVRMIRSYLNMRERYTVEFQICTVQMVVAGNFAIAIRSDML